MELPPDDARELPPLTTEGGVLAPPDEEELAGAIAGDLPVLIACSKALKRSMMLFNGASRRISISLIKPISN